MSDKTDTEVIIGGKVLTVSGNESTEYLQKVATYINNKINEYAKMDSYKRHPADKQNVLIQLNIADDYFKAKNQVELLESDLKTKENELYDLKHELISIQMKLDETTKLLNESNEQLNENSKQIVRLETELKECQK
jgi:cell division protein ZapA